MRSYFSSRFSGKQIDPKWISNELATIEETACETSIEREITESTPAAIGQCDISETSCDKTDISKITAGIIDDSSSDEQFCCFEGKNEYADNRLDLKLTAIRNKKETIESHTKRMSQVN